MDDCSIALSLANCSGLILAARVGKQTDERIEALIVTTQGKPNGNRWNRDVRLWQSEALWGGYERGYP